LPPAKDSRQLVILTGLSGSGKGSVLRAFEDLGFYCVDNLPVALIPAFSELYRASHAETEGAALLVDAREGDALKRFPEIYRRLRRELPVKLVFIEASTPALVRRFSETRRPHPMARGGTVRDAIQRERERMAPIRRLADIRIDSSRFNVHELRRLIVDRFQPEGKAPLLISVVSFGYRYGLPVDADIVLDVRFLPNPYFQAKLRPLSGKDARVGRYIRSFPQTREFLRQTEKLLGYLLPHYIAEGKSYLTIAFGCTGGRHRSVALAESVAKEMMRRGYATKVSHRDIDKGTG
jgi:RNase adapter protein RapZ